MSDTKRITRSETVHGMKSEYVAIGLVDQLVDSESEMLRSCHCQAISSLCDVPRDSSRFVSEF